MSNTVIHIGLHKTATRFLQRAVFSSLDDRDFCFNPPKLMQALQQAIRHPGSSSRSTFLQTAQQIRAREENHRTLVISDPDISGNMFDNHADCFENLALVRKAFPSATVLYFVRRQSDWLHSAYRQSLVKGRSAPIEVFLNYRDGDFRQRLARRVDGMRTLDALDLRFLEIYRAYAEAYGPEHVYLFRQEDLRTSAEAVYSALARALGLERLPEPPTRVSGNRAYSALAIRLLHPWTLHMPDLGRAKLTNEDPPGRRQWLIHPLRRLRTAFIRHVFDRLLYVDWDLLARSGMRERLDAVYADENRCLQAIAEIILQQGPCFAALEVAQMLDTSTRRERAVRRDGD